MSENITALTTTRPENNVWQSGEAPRGFQVQMLPEHPNPVPVEDAFATTTEITNMITQRYENHDGIRKLDVAEGAAPGELEVSFRRMATVSLDRGDFDGAIEQGRIPAGLARRTLVTPDEAKKYGIVGIFPDQEEKAFEANLGKELGEQFRPDWTYLPEGSVERQKQLSQIIDFQSSGHQVNLYNFTPTQLSEEEISRIANALRAMCDRTGGYVMEALDVIAILPNDDPLVCPTNERGEITYNAAGAVHEGALVLSEGLINADAPYPEVTVETTAKSLLMADDVKGTFLVPGDELQQTVFHELAHLVARNGKYVDYNTPKVYAKAVGWEWVDEKNAQGEMQRHFVRRGNVVHPIGYGRMNYEEDLAVTAEADFAGEGRLLDDARRLGLAALWGQRHSQIEGPSFVRATELPLPVLPDKVGQLPTVPLAIMPRYGYSIRNAR